MLLRNLHPGGVQSVQKRTTTTRDVQERLNVLLARSADLLGWWHLRLEEIDALSELAR